MEPKKGIKVASIIKFMQQLDPIDYETDSTRAGNSVKSVHLDDDRYIVDFAPDFATEGWQQFDTNQDAWYFGVWVNPKKWMTLSYAEGDWSLVECPTVEQYLDEIKRMCLFYGEGYVAKAIDHDGSVTIYRQDRAEFVKVEP